MDVLRFERGDREGGGSLRSHPPQPLPLKGGALSVVICGIAPLRSALRIEASALDVAFT